ncbi:MAG TPA: condensation domain-containing protein, partial [Thermoanaerobaculia bacterium]|nr:condensation domain-containing protein [Thermoanaerobaculia bacterium]
RALGHRLQYARAGAVTAADAFLQKPPISFDVSLLEIFAPLAIGGRTVLARPGGQQDPEYLVKIIQEQRITYTSFPPSLMYALFEAEGFSRCDSLRVVVTGGETVPAVLPGQFYERLPGAALLNRYGPTEATISVTSWLCEREGAPRSLLIGRPTAKARVYLLDAAFQPVPVGIPGEILLGGLCVARGYHRRPDLTAERFVPDPFSGEPGSRLYRTGDLARYRPDGAIEFVGRTDNQVKIRGFRVELGEIEAALARHPAVREVAVVDREEGPTRSLAAYVVLQPGVAMDEAGLRGFLVESLPPYMVPADFVVLDALPLSPTGKVDRQALPAPERQGTAMESEPPRTQTEEMVAAVWADLLSLQRLGIHDSFFDLGGHSLLATQAMARVRESFGIDLPLRLLFERPTVAELAAEIDAAVRAGSGLEAPPLVPQPRGEGLPLSFAQQRLWFLDQLQPGSAAYNMSTAVRLRGPLDLAAFRRSLSGVAGRHESLRTTFPVRRGMAVQAIAPELTLPVAIVDLQDLPGPARERAVETLAREERLRPFDLVAGPLLRATVLKTITEAGDEHVILLTLHHVVTDGWSMGVLVQEIAELYRAFATGTVPSLPDLPIQYADYAIWQRAWLSGETLEAQLSYWRRQLAGLPPLLELPADRPRPALQSFRGGLWRHFVPADQLQGLRELCREKGATLYMGLMAIFQSLLHLYSGQDDLAVGSPVAGRSRVETERLIGFFVNNLVLRGDLGGNPGFRQILARTREAALGAYAHQDLPFEKLVEELAGERNLSHAPLFQVALVLQNTPRQVVLQLPGATLSRGASEEASTAKFDITLNARETEAGLGLLWSFNRDLFDSQTIGRMAGHFEALSAHLLAQPDLGLEDHSILSSSERQQLLQWSLLEAGEPEGLLLHELLEEQARLAPERVAVIHTGGSLTYRELNTRANRLARRLRAMGVAPEVKVGLFLERSPEMVIALFGILKAGGAYVPLDPDHPAERVAWVLEDSGLRLLLTEERLLGRLPAVTGLEILRLDAIREESGEEPEAAPVSGATAESLAYVIYTSGSTGRPKGVLVPHRGLGNLSAVQARLFRVTEESRVLQFASLTFDASISEIAMSVRAGAALCLAPRSALLPGAELVDLLRRWEISKVTLPPSVAATLPTQDFP